MGKQRRDRQQYHFKAKKSNEDTEMDVEDSTSQNNSAVASTSTNISLENNPFSNMSIDVGTMRKSLRNVDDDTRSVMSFKSAKSEMAGGSIMKKKDKIKMRRELLMQKINFVSKKMKDAEKKHAEWKQYNILGNTDPMLDALGFVTVKDPVTGKEIVTKSRPIQKADKRKKDHLKGIDIYQKILKNTQFMSNPLAAIKDHVKAVTEAEKNKAAKKK